MLTIIFFLTLFCSVPCYGDAPKKPAVSYIATVVDYFGKLEVKVLASNAYYPEHIGRVEDVEGAQALVAQKFPGMAVTWVTPYRFAKVASC